MITLGCAKNLVDTEILVGGLKNNNYKIASSKEDWEIDNNPSFSR